MESYFETKSFIAVQPISQTISMLSLSRQKTHWNGVAVLCWMFVICKAVTCVVMFYYCNVKSQVHDVMLTFHNVKSCHHDVMSIWNNVYSKYHDVMFTYGDVMSFLYNIMLFIRDMSLGLFHSIIPTILSCFCCNIGIVVCCFFSKWRHHIVLCLIFLWKLA
jgi:hypothetical protein